MLRLSIWILVLAAFVAAGIRGIVPHIEWRAPLVREPDATTDEMSLSLLQLGDGTRLLDVALDGIPRDRALMVIGPGDNWHFPEIHYLLSYIAWPRPVWALGQMNGDKVSDYNDLPRSRVDVAAMLFYLVPPPPELVARAHNLGPNLVLVPLPDKAP